ncbi:condensation domain-containing protein [Granulicella aggregans]|uniref:condensation domain-containing protein n=1 Tax=Granulicella aggregans TaxID=474949 RepID=UPI0021E0E7F0|nr:condensation domain-containing protein [Granulicella aggregans]
MGAKSITLGNMADSATDTPPGGEGFYAFPLTPGQRGMWPQGLTTLGDRRCNGAFRMQIAGEVDAAVLEASLRAVAMRQEMLRTSFKLSNGEPIQVVSPSFDLSIEVVDLTSVAESARSLLVDEISTQEAQQTFDLTLGVPLRVKLLRLEEKQSLLTITAHQIICDGWSVGILMQELSEAYNALSAGDPSPLHDLDFQYGDYVAWQGENQSAPATRSQLDYWKKQLARAPQLSVSFDKNVSADMMEAGIVSALLPRELTDDLLDLAKSENATFYVVTMAACMLLLSRYTGLSDIALRTPLAGRNRVEFEPIIGQFVNQVIIRNDLRGASTVSDLLAQVRDNVWDALANQEIAFEEVMEAIPVPHKSALDLFRINFVCQKEYGRNGPSEFKLGEAAMITMPSKSQGALYDLNFFLVQREIGWRLSLEYKAGLYTQETAESLLLHFQEVLRFLAKRGNQKLAELVLSPTESLTKRTIEDAGHGVGNNAGDAFSALEDEPSSQVIAMPGSLAQERFWTLSQLDPTNPSFHVPVVMQIAGQLSSEVLAKSFQLLIDRHESLRTTFNERDGEFLQVIHPSYRVSLPSTTVSGRSEAERATNLASTIQQEILKPFDLNALPLFRTMLCKVGDEEHVLIVTLHHILADAASAQVIQRELWTTYESLNRGEEPSLPQLAIQYADFSVWQRDNLDSDAMKEHLRYWLDRLSGDLQVLDFPTDHPPAYRPTAKGAVETLLLPEELTRSVKQLGQANDATLYVVTLACFAAMLSRASVADDLTIGSPVLNRRAETEALIGPFAGPMAIRLNLAGNPTMAELIQATRDRTLEALDHTDLPFELLLRNLTLRTQNDRRPLFQFYFMCQTAFVQTRQIEGLTVTPLPSMSVGTPFEMQLAMIERSEGLRAELEYNADLFDKTTVKKWLAYYQTLLKAVVESPDRRVNDLPAPPFVGGHSVAHASHARETRGAGGHAALDRPYVAPRDLVEEMVAQVWEGVLGVPSISVHANFFDIGGTSLLILKLIPRINAAFDLVLPVPTIFKAPTIELMANVLRQRNIIEKQVVLPLHPSGNRPPLFMIHSYHLYRALPAALGSDQPFYGVMELELSDRHLPYTLKDQVQNYVNHIREVQPKGPYYIAGFCFFGLVAFEVGAQLEALGEKVAFIGLIDTYCPDYWCVQQSVAQVAPTTSRLMPRVAALGHHMRKTRGLKLQDKLKLHGEFVMEKLRNQWLSLLLETRVAVYTHFVKKGTKLPSWLKDPALVTRVGVRRHRPAKIASDVYLFPAEDVPLDAEFDPTLGWGVMTTGKVHTMWIPGDHDDMFKEKHIGALAQTIRETMDKARS